MWLPGWIAKWLSEVPTAAAQKEKYETQIMLLNAKHEAETNKLKANADLLEQFTLEFDVPLKVKDVLLRQFKEAGIKLIGQEEERYPTAPDSDLAIARGPHPSLHHASFELRGLDEYMRGTGRLLRAGVEKIWGPGRHLAGNNTFSYFLDPHGNTVEYTTELEQVDEDSWHPHLYDFTQPEVADQWGTANQMNEFVARKSFNDPDRGLFVAPPV